jgi:Zn finger protein HypA/HybF involved in hydrogenase expression
MIGMALRRCAHCRYLFEATSDVCPACKQPVGAVAPDEELDIKKTIKRPAIKKD